MRAHACNKKYRSRAHSSRQKMVSNTHHQTKAFLPYWLCFLSSPQVPGCTSLYKMHARNLRKLSCHMFFSTRSLLRLCRYYCTLIKRKYLKNCEIFVRWKSEKKKLRLKICFSVQESDVDLMASGLSFRAISELIKNNNLQGLKLFLDSRHANIEDRDEVRLRFREKIT